MKVRLLSIILTLVLYSCSNERQENTYSYLNSEWTFSELGSDSIFKAKVPGNIHLDLYNNGLIPDPFYSNNEYKMQWIENKNWKYQTIFDLDKNLLEYDRIELLFEGLDTYADVSLNDSLIMQTENMFVGRKIDVKNLLKQKLNRLEIVFYSPIAKAMPLHLKSGFTYPADNDKSTEHLSVYTRKAAYHYGWDWGPRFVTSGIWRNIAIKAWNTAKINDVYIVQKALNSKSAQLNFVYELEANRDCQAKLSLIESQQILDSKIVELKKGINRVEMALELTDPILWWPNGLGQAHLYGFRSELEIDSQRQDSKENNFGIREIKVVNQKDSLGQSFYLQVNGHNTYLKGANYIPSDSFLGGVTDSVYENIFKNALASNFNALRVWGGGIYENDKFYDLADKYGILIWQDFMFACTMYPGDSAFLKNVENEVDYNIKRLRNHPSLALWCGNNEIEVAWENWGWQKTYNYSPELQQKLMEQYNALFNDLLPKKVAELDNRFYFSSSPISNWGNKEDLKYGDNHYWGVWWGRHEFEKFNEYIPRFMSEFGFQAFPILKTIESFADKNQWEIDSKAMRSHQKSSIGNGVIKEYMDKYYREPKGFENFVYLSQVMQAEGMRMAFEAHRRNKPYNMGSLYWQFNDVWPAISWSGIDYHGRWKAMQYFVKKAFENIMASIFIDNNRVKVNIISDLRSDSDVKIEYIIGNFDGKIYYQKEEKLLVKANSNSLIFDLNIDSLIDLKNRNRIFIATRIHFNEKVLENIKCIEKPKNLDLSKPKIQIEYIKSKEYIELELSADTFVKNIELSCSIGDNWSDNYFDMLPNKKYRIRFYTDKSIEYFKKEFKFRTLIDSYR